MISSTSSTPTNYPIEYINTQETDASKNAQQSSHIHDFDLNFPPKISDTDSENDSILRDHQTISFDLNSNPTPGFETPTSRSNLNIENTSPGKESKSNQQSIEPSPSRSQLYSESNFHQPSNEPPDFAEIIAMKSFKASKLLQAFQHLNYARFDKDQSHSDKTTFRLSVSNAKNSKLFLTLYLEERCKNRSSDPNDDDLPSAERKKSFWTKLVIEKDESDPTRREFLSYKQQALSDLNREISEIKGLFDKQLGQIGNQRKRITPNNKRKFNMKSANMDSEEPKEKPDPYNLRFRRFSRAMVLFPLYLLHVDLINRVLPVPKNHELGQLTLSAQRRIAGKRYLNLVMYLICTKGNIGLPDQIPIGQINMVPDRKDPSMFSTSCARGRSFIWQAIHDWIANCRPEIVDIAADGTVISNPFRNFFNHLIENWSLSLS